METSLELYHHGVKGQHWGTRNGPPYPLYRKSAYYKKTGKRPPGYTGNKSGRERSSGGGKIGGLSDIKRAGDTSWVRERLKKDKIGGYNDDDKRSATKKKILKGVGIAAGAAALAGAGYLAYKNRAAIGSRAGKLRNDIRYKLGELPGTAKLNQTRMDLKNKILGVGKKAKGLVNEVKTPTSALRNDIRYKLGELPGTAKLNQTRMDLNNKILGVGKKAKGLVNEVKTPTSALRNDIRLIGASAKGTARNVRNKVKNVGTNVKNVAAKPSQTVYNKIAGKSKAALNVAKAESQTARRDSRTLKDFIDNNAKSIEKATIAKRKALAQIRRGEGNIKELNKAANNWAAKEKALIAKQNTAKALAPRATADRISKAEAVRQAQEVFNKRNKLGRIAAGATNAGIGLGLAGAAGGAGYGISRLARKRRSRKRRRSR